MYRQDCTHSYWDVMESRNDEKAIVDIPSETMMSKRMDAWIGSGNVLILEGDGREYLSAGGSGSGIWFWLNNAREVEDEVVSMLCWNAPRRRPVDEIIVAFAFAVVAAGDLLLILLLAILVAKFPVVILAVAGPKDPVKADALSSKIQILSNEVTFILE